MIARAQSAAVPSPASMNPVQRADLIYRNAQSELARSLWQAALGEGDSNDNRFATWSQPSVPNSALDGLLAMINKAKPAALQVDAPPASAPSNDSGTEPQVAPVSLLSVDSPLRIESLGANARFGDAITRAAQRTGLPATALASIIDAEAGRGRDGSWNVHSRNPRSSAAGLGQFLSGTWETEAERPGTWLNAEADRRGWLNDKGRVTGDSRSALLALRYDPEANIQAIADYANGNLHRLGRAGVHLGDDVGSIARAAYLGHHLGAGDAAKFLGGGLDPARARRLLDAQVGHAEASRRLAATGNATDAHRGWLLAYTERRIRPQKFA